MITGGNATVFVADMDRAVRFYTEAIGLKLTNRFANHYHGRCWQRTDHRLASGLGRSAPLLERRAASCLDSK
jgi:catechol 2,3-dioxygenase-like lactoylglutathione lyase family enzyme